MKELPSNIAELTSLRFFAAAWVVLFHFYDHLGALSGLSTKFFEKGYLGVDLFFILSGFILAHVYLASAASGTFSYRGFLLNRLARVYPLHITLVAAFVLVYWLADVLGFASAAVGRNWSHLPQHILMLHAWGLTDAHAWNFPSWSISAEFFAYLLFPLYLLVARVRMWLAVVGSLASFAIAYAITDALGYRLTALMYNFGIARIAVEFLMGVATYLACRSTNLKAPAALVLGIVASITVVCHFGGSDLVIVPLFAALIFAIAQRSKSSKPWIMQSKALVYLGDISYSTYMIHYLVQLVFLALAAKLLGLAEALPLWAWGLMVALVYVGSAVTYHLVELPARQAIRSAFARPRSAPSTP